MTLLLIHHADAVGPEVDPQRPLSTEGFDHAQKLAEAVKSRGVALAAIWHSGKLRSRQTAEAFLRICQPFAEFKMVRGLGPADQPEILRDAFLRESRDIAIVGHWPHFPALLTLLSPSSARMPRHGVVALESIDGGMTWIERWRIAAI